MRNKTGIRMKSFVNCSKRMLLSGSGDGRGSGEAYETA